MTQRAVLLQALASTPRDVQRLLRMLPPDGWRWRPDGDGWSAQQVLDHLVGVETIYRARLQRIRDNGRLAPAHLDAAPTSDPGPAEGLLEAFAATRRDTLAFLTDLSPGEWQRRAIDRRVNRAERDSQAAPTLRWQVMELMNHDLAHLGQLVDIRVKWEASNGHHPTTSFNRDGAKDAKTIN